MLALETLGVLLCAATVAGGLVRLLRWEIEPALPFGALTAATDPIAVIELLRESRVTGRLRLLLESTLVDAPPISSRPRIPSLGYPVPTARRALPRHKTPAAEAPATA